MKDNMIITVGREFCSGGAEIAHKVADHFGIPYYDKEIIDKTADMMNLSQKEVEKHDEHPVSYWDVSGFQYGTPWYLEDPSLLLPLSMRIADAQFKIINELAIKGACVIVGRCADNVLEGRKNVVNVFVRADIQARIKRAQRLYDISEAQAKRLIKHTDKIRASYYNNYTHNKWGGDHYDLIIESDAVNSDIAAARIIDFVNDK